MYTGAGGRANPHFTPELLVITLMTCLQSSKQSLGSNLLHLQIYQIFSTFLIEWFAILGINFKITYLQIKSFSRPEVGNCLLPHTELHRCLDMRKINCSQKIKSVIGVILHKNLFMDLISVAGVLFLWHIPVENIIMVLLRIPFLSYAAVMFAMESSIHDIIPAKLTTTFQCFLFCCIWALCHHQRNSWNHLDD